MPTVPCHRCILNDQQSIVTTLSTLYNPSKTLVGGAKVTFTLHRIDFVQAGKLTLFTQETRHILTQVLNQTSYILF